MYISKRLKRRTHYHFFHLDVSSILSTNNTSIIFCLLFSSFDFKINLIKLHLLKPLCHVGLQKLSIVFPPFSYIIKNGIASFWLSHFIVILVFFFIHTAQLLLSKHKIHIGRCFDKCYCPIFISVFQDAAEVI